MTLPDDPTEAAHILTKAVDAERRRRSPARPVDPEIVAVLMGYGAYSETFAQKYYRDSAFHVLVDLFCTVLATFDPDQLNPMTEAELVNKQWATLKDLGLT